MIKLFATDLDGTLLAKNHKADEYINEMVHMVFDAGCYFAFATGRNANRATPEEIDRPVYHICMNGALITDLDNTVLYVDTINKDILKELLETFPDFDFDCASVHKTYRRSSKEDWIAEHNKPFKPRHVNPNEKVDTDWHKQFMQDMLENIVFDCSNEDILSHDICKVNLHLRNKNYDTKKFDEFLEFHKNQIMNAPCDTGIYEITNTGTDKGSAVQWLANYLHVDKDEVATYGDGGNDIPMLERFKHSYAPSNGLDYVKKKASEIIGPHYEHSVSQHIIQTIKESR